MSGIAGDVATFASGHQGDLLRHTVEHVQISAISIAIAVALALPLALWLGHKGRGGFLAVNASNVGRALPSLALLAIALPLPHFGLSERTVIFALVLLAIPPILTNGYVAVREVDRDVVEAARGMGMSGFQVLRGVELPLAFPVILSGIRTAAVQVVATATLGALIAGGGLGRFIVDGLASNDTPQIVTGAIAVAVLAVLTEVAFGLLERAATPKPLRRLTAREDRDRRLVVPAGRVDSPM